MIYPVDKVIHLSKQPDVVAYNGYSVVNRALRFSSEGDPKPASGSQVSVLNKHIHVWDISP